MNPHGYERITSLSSAQGLDVPQSFTKLAVIQTEVSAVRWRDDETDPTSSVGMRLEPGQELQYDGDLTRLTFIQETSGAILNISYYG